MEFDVDMILGRTLIRYVPRFVSRLTGIPQLCSNVDTNFTSIVKFEGETFRYDKIRGVYTCYWMKDLAPWEWSFISAMNSENNLFTLEFVVAKAFGNWHASGYLKYGGREYRVGGLLDPVFRIEVLKPGIEEDNYRKFTLKLKFRDRRFLVEAQAPDERFVLLHSGYGGRIQTTLFGDCKVTEFASDGFGGWKTVGGGSANANCLLESKERG